jgi:YVTN family beta-propeller protein
MRCSDIRAWRIAPQHGLPFVLFELSGYSIYRLSIVARKESRIWFLKDPSRTVYIGECEMFDRRWIAVFGLSLLGLSLTFDSADAFLAYVSNEKGNTISVIDTDKMETVATIKTGQRPRGIEVSRDGKFVFVALGDDDVIQV